jgi:hypothetical protein
MWFPKKLRQIRESPRVSVCPRLWLIIPALHMSYNLITQENKPGSCIEMKSRNKHQRIWSAGDAIGMKQSVLVLKWFVLRAIVSCGVLWQQHSNSWRIHTPIYSETGSNRPENKHSKSVSAAKVVKLRGNPMSNYTSKKQIHKVIYMIKHLVYVLGGICWRRFIYLFICEEIAGLFETKVGHVEWL